MKKLPFLLSLFTALSLCAAAQTISGVTLTGDPNNPTIVNHTGKQIIAVEIANTLSDGVVGMEDRLFTKTPNELPDGGTQSVGRYARNHTVISVQVVAVIFSDGELRGDGESHNFRQDMEARFQAMRQVWQMAKSGNWAGVTAKSKSDTEMPGDFMAIALAQKLLAARGKQGADAAVKADEHIGNLPASTWKGGLLNRLQIPNILQALERWIMPTAYAQSQPFCCVAPHPYAYYNPPYYPNQWNYYCSTYTGSNAYCPSPGGSTPYLGVSAYCYDSGGYNIGVQVSVAVDDFNLTIYNGARQYAPPTHTIYNRGSCSDNDGISPVEGWEYDKSCTGPADKAPKKITDTTTFICGASYLGF